MDSTATPLPCVLPSSQPKSAKRTTWLTRSVVTGGDAAVLAAVAAWAGGTIGWIYGAAVLALLVGSGAHGRRVGPSLLPDVGAIVVRMAVVVAALGAFSWSSPAMPGLMRVLPVGVAGLLATRFVTYAIVRQLVKHAQRPVLIAGCGPLAVEFATVLWSHPEFGLRPLGFIDSAPRRELVLPILGGVDALRSIAAEHDCRDVIVAFGNNRDPDIVHTLRECAEDGLDIWVIPRFHELGITPTGPHTLDVRGLPLVALPRRPGEARRLVKRSVDVLVSGLALIVASPLFAAIAVLVKLSSPGPVFFRQRRVGLGGAECNVLKFRSMRVHTGSDTTWTEEKYVTRIGSFLRSSSLDELPQLVNVLRGDMSLVGPRPERPHFADNFAATIRGYEARNRVQPGITGWAQVHGLRGDTSIEERVRFDNRYIERWSLFWDISIMIATVPAVLRDLVTSAAGAVAALRLRRAAPARPFLRVATSLLLAASLIVGMLALVELRKLT